MIFGIVSLVICTIMTFEKELTNNNRLVIETTVGHILTTTVNETNTIDGKILFIF